MMLMKFPPITDSWCLQSCLRNTSSEAFPLPRARNATVSTVRPPTAWAGVYTRTSSTSLSARSAGRKTVWRVRRYTREWTVKSIRRTWRSGPRTTRRPDRHNRCWQWVYWVMMKSEGPGLERRSGQTNTADVDGEYTESWWNLKVRASNDTAARQTQQMLTVSIPSHDEIWRSGPRTTQRPDKHSRCWRWVYLRIEVLIKDLLTTSVLSFPNANKKVYFDPYFFLC